MLSIFNEEINSIFSKLRVNIKYDWFINALKNKKKQNMLIWKSDNR